MASVEDLNAARGETSLAELLAPNSVAIIGASEDMTKFGGRLFRSLVQHGFAGLIYPINPHRETLLGIKSYPSIADTPTPPDIAVMAVPREAVKGVIEACVAVGTKAAVIITSKFSDAGEEGARLERELVALARSGGLRLIGPNCLGFISPARKLALCPSPALFVDRLPVGEIGLVSQSGALMATMFDRAMTRGIGFSHCFSIGNQADLDLGDFVAFLAADDCTKVICSYVEGIKDPVRFRQAARLVRASGKPWLMVKAGRTRSGAAAAFSHTASLAGSYETFEAVCRDCGILLMDDIDAMVLLAAGLGRFPGRSVDAVAVVTTSGGGGAIAADRLSDAGIPLSRFGEQTVALLEACYTPSHACINPLDLGAAMAGGSVQASQPTMRALMDGEGIDLVLPLITTAPDVRLTCERLLEGAERDGAAAKPCLIVLLPGQAGDSTRRFLAGKGALYSDNLDEAIRAIAGWRRLSQLAPPLAATPPEALADVQEDRLRLFSGEHLFGALSEATAKVILSRYGVKVNAGLVVTDTAQVQAVVQQLKAPLAVKIMSPDILHKSDVGGVVLGLSGADEVALAIARMGDAIAVRRPDARIEGFLVQEMAQGCVELFVGARNDPQFGPLILVGAGGVLVELFCDVAAAPAPISPARAAEMIGKLKIAAVLRGFRGAPALDIEAVAESVSRVSWLVWDLGERFEELDINPLIVGEKGQGCVAVDARILCRAGSPGERWSAVSVAS